MHPIYNSEVSIDLNKYKQIFPKCKSLGIQGFIVYTEYHSETDEFGIKEVEVDFGENQEALNFPLSKQAISVLNKTHEYFLGDFPIYQEAYERVVDFLPKTE